MEFKIDCQTRPEGSKPNALRRSGKLPAVLYGHKGTESISLMMDSKAAELLLRDASINNSLIQVNIPDLDWTGKALLREVQTHPWKRTPYHVSFFAVADHGSLEVDVPLHFVGTAKGVKEFGGSLDPSMNSLHVKCIAEQIPDFIEVDVTHLNVGESITISQLNLPAGVEPTGDPDRMVATILSGGGKEG